jgi:glycosyltransferase involved in cell wall biosynthesis
MEKTNNLKILNIISGAKRGGAEKFFERFSVSIEKQKNLEQRVIIKKNKKRCAFLRKNKIIVEELAFRSKFDFYTRKKIKGVIKDFKPNIVLSWMNRASDMIPVDRNNYKSIGRLGGFYKIKNYLNCDYLIANTEDIKSYIIEQGWDPEKVFYVPNFVEKKDKNLIKKKDFTTPENKKIILGLGRFHENKGFDILIKSLKSLPDYYLWLLGNGEMKKKYNDLAGCYNLKNRIRFIDWVDNPSAFYNTADILVCPSRLEPLGNIIIEAWAHKIPVIASNIMGPKKLIKNEINGLKFESENVEELVSCVNRISNEKKLKNKLIVNGYKDYVSKYSENIIMEKFKSLFWEVSK